ncbi:hypothetical protein WJX73_002835 [Symbiochloris irregularis]|uniref:Rieske-like [2Fe-2S] domain-containing protein n=1 Tax=Symbiochloris irregularis TaxID=706552 RepID=A0AAW1PU01_9CHLO
MLYKSGDSYFCSAPNSTAYQFPLSDARVHLRGGKPAIEVPFDGTVYDLQSGKVLEWCPKNNPLRFVLGSLKAKATQEDLQVFPAEVEDGAILVKFG